MRLKHLFWLTGSALTVLAGTSPAFAQSTESGSAPAKADDAVAAKDIIVTGSRIQRSGFDAPTPTVVLSAQDLSVGDRSSVAAALNDNPQFRASVTPATTVATTNASQSPVDLRGLGSQRTLTLLDGHRFVGSLDLNTIPQNVVKRVDVVTGGASAAWGSGAVAGVVNIILDDELTGLKMGVDTGISSRGDGARYGANLAWGTKFADDRGHIMIAGDYLNDKGVFDRTSRPNLSAGLFSAADGHLTLAPNVNSTLINRNGSILNLSAQPYNLVFNPDGSVGPLPLGSRTNGSQTIGGNGQDLIDYAAVSAPNKRINLFGRVSYNVLDSLKFWANFSYNRSTADFRFIPNFTISLISPDNAFLTAAGKQQLATAGVASPFLLGTWIDDAGPGLTQYSYNRRMLEGSIGFDGSFGNGWTYKAYYDHGELRNNQALSNQLLSANFARAVDSVLVGGKAVCRVNAVTVTDPNCVPINIIGAGNITPAAVAYSFGRASASDTTKLDTAGFSFSGHPISTWAGAVDIAGGFDWRREQFTTNFVDPLSQAGAFSILNFSATNGSFNVKEFFGEGNVPLLNIENKARLELNGAVRYSDYNTSGGAWTWKYGGTLRLFDDLLFRTVYSRDIRSPNIFELFQTRSTYLVNVIDPYRNNQPASNVFAYSGGNPDLKPETSHTLTIGGSYSPHFVRGLRVSVDYYKIKIDGVITSITAQDTLNICHETLPNDPSCGGIIQRDSLGNFSTIQTALRNLAQLKTEGLDIDASYQIPLASGVVTFGVRANHVFKMLVNDGVNTTNVAGVVGDLTSYSTPKWKANGDVAFENQQFGVNLRVRYLSGGIYSNELGGDGLPISNNNIRNRTYFDLGGKVKVDNGKFEIFANVVNLFDRDPPPTYNGGPIYDTIGRYFSGGVKLRF